MLMRTREFAKMTPLAQLMERALLPLYYQDTVNHCPSCGGKHWHIGRSTAECAFCETALPLAAFTAPISMLQQATSKTN
jgi:hypothetical protein